MKYSSLCKCNIFCIHYSIEELLGSFQLLAIVSKATMTIVKHVSLIHVGASPVYIHRHRIAGSRHSTMSNFLRNHQTDFQSGCTSLKSHQQWRSLSFFLYSHQHLLSPEFLILAILRGVIWNLMVVLLCISMFTKGIGHLFRFFLAICYSSVENSLFSSVAHF